MRVFMPLYSKKAWGRFYGVYPHGYWWPNEYGFKSYAIYQRRHVWHGLICIKEHYYKSSNPYHPNCVIGQDSFSSAVKAWQGLTDQEKEVYNNYNYPGQMSGYNRFLHYYLKQN